MSYMQQSQSIDSGLWWREVQCLLQGTKQGNGRQASDPLPPGLWGFLFCFVLRGRTKRLGLIIVLGHFFNQSFKASGCFWSMILRSSDSWLMALGVCELLSSWRNNLSLYIQDDTHPAIFVHWWCYWQQQFQSSDSGWLVLLAHQLEVRGYKKENKILDREIHHKLGKGT